MRTFVKGTLAGLLASMAVLTSASTDAQEPRVTLPPGFRIDIFATGLGAPRFMTLDPSGTILVSNTRSGRVLALPDRDGNGKADAVITVVENLDRPHGLAFRDGALYVAETGRVLRFRYDPSSNTASQPSVVVPALPVGGGHFTRTIAFDSAGRLYVSVGSSCNVCREKDRRRAAIVRYNADGSGETLFAAGLRNAVGLAFHPTTGALWVTVNERDWRGEDLPPEYITGVKEGGFYGWPDCFASQGRVITDPSFIGAQDCPQMALPTIEVQAHSAPLGLAFYTRQELPAEYSGSLFVAYHGSWNRSVPTGYKLVRVPFRDGKPAGVEDFATGWLRDGRVWGRPVDVLVGSDGALFVSDDRAGHIYRITHRP